MPKIMKALGARKVAALGYGSSPSSVTNVKSFMQYAVPAVGLEPVYTNTSIDFGTADVGPLALGIKTRVQTVRTTSWIWPRTSRWRKHWVRTGSR